MCIRLLIIKPVEIVVFGGFSIGYIAPFFSKQKGKPAAMFLYPDRFFSLFLIFFSLFFPPMWVRFCGFPEK